MKHKFITSPLSTLKRTFYFAFVFITICTGFYLIAIPDVSQLKTHDPESTAFIERYRALHPDIDIKRDSVPFKEISPALIDAVVSSEDARFFEHQGFDFKEIENSIRTNWRLKKYKRGGSTITQQLAKNLYLSPHKSILRKLKEAIIIIQLERHLSKRRILELYLNSAQFGKGVFGIEAASKHYFGKSAKYLSPSESWYLADKLPNPE